MCLLCHNFDLCEQCECLGSRHPQEHPLIKLKEPLKMKMVHDTEYDFESKRVVIEFAKTPQVKADSDKVSVKSEPLPEDVCDQVDHKVIRLINPTPELFSIDDEISSSAHASDNQLFQPKSESRLAKWIESAEDLSHSSANEAASKKSNTS